jgi:hypothetical protein
MVRKVPRSMAHSSPSVTACALHAPPKLTPHLAMFVSATQLARWLFTHGAMRLDPLGTLMLGLAEA